MDGIVAPPLHLRWRFEAQRISITHSCQSPRFAPLVEKFRSTWGNFGQGNTGSGSRTAFHSRQRESTSVKQRQEEAELPQARVANEALYQLSYTPTNF